MAAGSVSAVTIRNFRTATCKGNYFQCTGIKSWTCCVGSAKGGTVTSSLFLGLPIAFYGAICKAKGGSNCGEVKNAGSDLHLCLGGANCKGSMWLNCKRCRKRDEEFANATSVAESGIPQELIGASSRSSARADVIAFENHQFKCDDSVPTEAKEKLFSLLEADAGYDDILEELKQYELKGKDRRGDEDWEAVM
ncbi:uncharacterized protein F4812DRAFT_457225 [Daldinia caldariorum]|uniref:uncharacterized protein n=1 Tax=Daldinia caldariorum TaxID=326644 RepID=UPI0020081991|nr:uncharacterized protein F4812DRAFT_457225 [Daldinia caldariorum]KAI1469822.1 hypothetical protein F4812DRAFT_457225 [Daldinia caldariorum]